MVTLLYSCLAGATQFDPKALCIITLMLQQFSHQVVKLIFSANQMNDLNDICFQHLHNIIHVHNNVL